MQMNSKLQSKIKRILVGMSITLAIGIGSVPLVTSTANAAPINTFSSNVPLTACDFQTNNEMFAQTAVFHNTSNSIGIQPFCNSGLERRGFGPWTYTVWNANCPTVVCRNVPCGTLCAGTGATASCTVHPWG